MSMMWAEGTTVDLVQGKKAEQNSMKDDRAGKQAE